MLHVKLGNISSPKRDRFQTYWYSTEKIQENLTNSTIPSAKWKINLLKWKKVAGTEYRRSATDKTPTGTGALGVVVVGGWLLPARRLCHSVRPPQSKLRFPASPCERFFLRPSVLGGGVGTLRGGGREGGRLVLRTGHDTTIYTHTHTRMQPRTHARAFN